jgi:hypothetical protein
MSKEHPMLFSTPMVQAILEGRKTMTRRIIKFPKDFDGRDVYENGQVGLKYSSNEFPGCVHRLHSKWQVEDWLWVRETFTYDFQECGFYCQKVCEDCRKQGNSEKIIFAADWKGHRIIFKPSIHMPKVSARIWLKVISIRAERLDDITWQDIEKEGIVVPPNEPFSPTHCDLWKELWTKINGKESLDANPWVWVIEFRILSTTGKPLYKKLSDVQGV